jgi:hypothetical protein
VGHEVRVRVIVKVRVRVDLIVSAGQNEASVLTLSIPQVSLDI